MFSLFQSGNEINQKGALNEVAFVGRARDGELLTMAGELTVNGAAPYTSAPRWSCHLPSVTPLSAPRDGIQPSVFCEARVAQPGSFEVSLVYEELEAAATFSVGR